MFASFPEHIAGYHVLHRLSMPRHPPDTLSSLTTFIDHRHDPLGEELALEGVTGGRAGNGTNDQQLGHFGNACFAGTRPIAKKVLDDSHPTERPKWVGSREFRSPQNHRQACQCHGMNPLNLIIHLSKSKPSHFLGTPAFAGESFQFFGPVEHGRVSRVLRCRLVQVRQTHERFRRQTFSNSLKSRCFACFVTGSCQ